MTSHCIAAASVRVLSSKLFVVNSIISVVNETLTSIDMKIHRRFYIKSLMQLPHNLLSPRQYGKTVSYQTKDERIRIIAHTMNMCVELV